jgi:hypothetical protein
MAASPASASTWDNTCLNCGKTSHFAKDCQRVKHGGQAHIAEAEENEPALFLVHESVELRPETKEGEKV